MGETEVVRYGITLDDMSFRSLLPHQCIDSCVIDAFIFSLASKYNDISLLNFPAEYVNIITSPIQNDFTLIKWCQNMRANKYDAWLLPVHDAKVHKTGHWTLFLIVFSQNSIVYFDSMHHCPENYWIERICSLIEHSFPNKKKTLLEWSEWTLYAPTDIPLQGTKLGTSNNCGSHVCVWSHILYAGDHLEFDESDMNTVRAWIMSNLLSTTLPKSRRGFVFETGETVTVLRLNDISKMAQSRDPARFFDNTLEYAASLKAILKATKV